MAEIPVALEPYLKGRVAVLGYGISGQAVVRLLKSLDVTYVVFDAKHEECESVFNFQMANDFDLVIYSPSFLSHHPWRQVAKEVGLTSISEFDFAACFWEGDCIAITGTNGKTTLTLFLTEALRAMGKTAISAGNVGYSMSQLVLEHPKSKSLTAVCEVSSFQAAELIFFNPKAVLWTNFSEDHLDYHASLREYFLAKWHLIQQAKGLNCFIGSSVMEEAYKLGLLIPAGVCSVTSAQNKLTKGTCFIRNPQLENFNLAHAYWEDQGYDLDVLVRTARSFTLPKYRLEKIATIEGVTFWNDSKATNFGAVIAALKAFKEPITWIGGGKYKGGDLETFIKIISGKIVESYVFGEVGPVLQTLLKGEGVAVTRIETLNEIITFVGENGVKSSDIVFSPGFSSFDQFKNFEHRGNCFEQAVLSLKNPVKYACSDR